jgi:hypothetical protein
VPCASFVVNKWVVNTQAVTVLIGPFLNFVRMFVSMQSRTSSKMGHLGSKTRSQELKIAKVCQHSSGCSFDPNILKICQENCLNNLRTT